MPPKRQPPASARNPSASKGTQPLSSSADAVLSRPNKRRGPVVVETAPAPNRKKSSAANSPAIEAPLQPALQQVSLPSTANPNQLDALIDTIVEKVCARLSQSQPISTQPAIPANLLSSTANELTREFMPQDTAMPSLLSSNHELTNPYNLPLHLPTGQEAVPLGSLLPPAIKGKILADEFVVFGQLLHPNSSSDYSVQIINNAMQLCAQSKNKGIHNIDQWNQAFSIFSAVYLDSYPCQAIPLLKYGYNIREMARQYPLFAWRSYDEAFRQARSVTKWPWDVISYELYIKAVSQAVVDSSSARYASASSGSRVSGSSDVASNACYPSASPYNEASTFHFPTYRKGGQNKDNRPQYTSGQAGGFVRGGSADHASTAIPSLWDRSTNPSGGV